MRLSFGSMVSQHLLRLISAFFVTVILNPAISFAGCIEQLEGKAYVNLPQNVCPDYTDILLGRTVQQQEYGGVICDRPHESYILLQKLLNYTQQGKAVWQVVQIKQVAKPTPQSFVMGVGCELKVHNAGQDKEPIFALVQPRASEEYKTIAAWTVNLEKSSFSALKAQQVVCKNPLL
jgi:hypothetical protein